MSVARWTEPTAVELPAVTADNLSKVGTWWFRVVLVSSPSKVDLVSSTVPTPNNVLVMGVSSGGADWQVSTCSVLGVLGLGLVCGEPVTIQSVRWSRPTELISSSSVALDKANRADVDVGDRKHQC